MPRRGSCHPRKTTALPRVAMQQGPPCTSPKHTCRVRMVRVVDNARVGGVEQCCDCGQLGPKRAALSLAIGPNDGCQGGKGVDVPGANKVTWQREQWAAALANRSARTYLGGASRRVRLWAWRGMAYGYGLGVAWHTVMRLAWHGIRSWAWRGML